MNDKHEQDPEHNQPGHSKPIKPPTGPTPQTEEGDPPAPPTGGHEHDPDPNDPGDGGH